MTKPSYEALEKKVQSTIDSVLKGNDLHKGEKFTAKKKRWQYFSDIDICPCNDPRTGRSGCSRDYCRYCGTGATRP